MEPVEDRHNLGGINQGRKGYDWTGWVPLSVRERSVRVVPLEAVLLEAVRVVPLEAVRKWQAG